MSWQALKRLLNCTARCKIFASRRAHILRIRVPRDLSRAKRRWTL